VLVFIHCTCKLYSPIAFAGVSVECYPRSSTTTLVDTADTANSLQQSFYMVCHKTQSNYFSERYQTATKRSNFWHSNLRDNYESACDYLFHLTCVIPIPGKNVSYKLYFGDKQNSQTVKPQIQKFSAWKHHKMCIKCLLGVWAQRRRRHWLMAATTIEWSSFLHPTNSLFQFCKMSLK